MNFKLWLEALSADQFITCFTGDVSAIKQYLEKTFVDDPALKNGFLAYKSGATTKVSMQIKELYYKINVSAYPVIDFATGGNLSKSDNKYRQDMKIVDDLPKIEPYLRKSFFITKKTAGSIIGGVVANHEFYKLGFFNKHVLDEYSEWLGREYEPEGYLIGAHQASPEQVLLGLEQQIAVYKLGELLGIKS